MRAPTRRGLLLAAGIVLSWLGSLVFLLPTTPSRLHGGVLAGAVLLRTLLQTGLFIVAHDAMHGSLWPGRPRRNHCIGQTALLLYGALPYGKCLSNHHRHHRHAGTADDPDHHGQGRGRETWIGWYATFMASYLSARQILSLAVLWVAWAAVAWFVTPTPLQNIGLFCILPTLLSSLQLFLVGTFLPHRDSSTTSGSHQPRSLELPSWLSLLSCYHFGYHWEHHAFPHLAWHELPEARQRTRAGREATPPFALLLSER